MTELERKILEQIASRKLAPKPAYVFLARRSVFWSLALVSVLLGALSTAILLFAVSDYFATGWRVLDNIHFNEILLGIPLLWLALMGALTASAVYGMRNTRRGYRFKASHISMAALALSLGLGLLLFVSNAASDVHEYLERRFPAYREFTYVPFAEWSHPDDGRLGGTVLSEDGRGGIKLQDFHDKIWSVDVSAAVIDLDNTLVDEGDVQITGERTGPDTFRARTIAEFD